MHLWIGRARHLGSSTGHLAVEVFNVVGGSRMVIWFLKLKLTLLLLLSIG